MTSATLDIQACTPKGFSAVFFRELKQYFDTPLAYVLMVVFLVISGMFTFYLGNFYDAGNAELSGFFRWHPWLYLFFIPAVTMRLWAEEQRQGTMELLMTLPITPLQALFGKFFAAWIFLGAALAGTFPVWITVNYLGDPDNGAIAAGYVASFLMASSYIAAGLALSAVTRNQVIAFIFTVTVCFLFIVAGFPMALDFFSAFGAPQALIDTFSYFSFLTRFEEMSRGIIGFGHFIYFLTLTGFWLAVNYLTLQRRFNG